MASRKIEDLVQEMQPIARAVIEHCREQGVELLITCTLRSAEEQAKLYRQGRSGAQVLEKISRLRAAGFGFLADILQRVGPQSGSAIVTNAGPGESWHNYRRAFDVVPIVHGKPCWNTGAPQWQIFGRICKHFGLEWAGDWKGFKEYPHAQMATGSNPLKVYGADEIRRMLNV